MAKYITKRILMLVPVLLGVSIIVFIIMRVFHRIQPLSYWDSMQLWKQWKSGERQMA